MKRLKINYDYLKLLLIISGATAASVALNQLGVDKENALMILIVGVLLVTAMTKGYRFGIIASFASVMMFNYFFAEPLHTFAINDSNDIALMLFFLIASMISSSLTARFQRQFLISRRNERTAKLLYEVSQRLLNVAGEDSIVEEGLQCIKEFTGCESTVELTEKKKLYCSKDFSSVTDQKVVELEITGIVNKLGILKVYYGDKSVLEDKWLVNTVAAQMGIALDREFVCNERENIKIAMERERFKSNILRSLSHDLRTPLTGIAGASSYILQRSKSLDRESMERLVGDINEQAVWLGTLVENLLSMIRIDNGKLEVKKQFEVVDDVVNEAVSHVNGLNERSFRKSLPLEVIAVPMDGKMIVQVLINLLNNAVTNTSKGCSIELEVKRMSESVVFNVADGGTGIDPSIENKLFEAFVTSGKIGADGKKGVGLGLTICKAFIQAHGGSLSTGRSHLGGALFSFTLPCEGAETNGK